LRLCLFLGTVFWMLWQPAVAGATALADGRNQDQVVHTVQPGENLFRISLRYGTTIDAIMAANGLTDSRTIHVGQRLVIPGASSVSSSASPSTATGGTYTVQRGDTLTRIALRHSVTVGALIEANGLSRSHIIYVGQQLLIPGTGNPAPARAGTIGDTYVVRSGDTLTRIAYRFGLTPGVLAQLNGIVNPSAIYTGQVLRLSEAAPPAPRVGGKRIVVDLSEQHLYAYQGEQLVYSFVASSGAAPSYTRTGEFRVQSKVPKAYGSTWNIWMPYWLGIYWAGSTENGIHALPILPNGQTLWAGYLGRPVSYGCIVLGSYEAQLLYNWATIGTPVTVRY
jgi:LysM repeat protein